MHFFLIQVTNEMITIQIENYQVYQNVFKALIISLALFNFYQLTVLM